MALNVEFINQYPLLLVTELEYNTTYRALESGFEDAIVMRVKHAIDEDIEYILVLYSDGATRGLYNILDFSNAHFIKVQSTLTVIG